MPVGATTSPTPSAAHPRPDTARSRGRHDKSGHRLLSVAVALPVAVALGYTLLRALKKRSPRPARAAAQPGVPEIVGKDDPFESLLRRLRETGCEALLRHWDDLDEEGRASLAADVGEKPGAGRISPNSGPTEVYLLARTRTARPCKPFHPR